MKLLSVHTCAQAREDLARALSAAILAHTGRAEHSALERIVQQLVRALSFFPVEGCACSWIYACACRWLPLLCFKKDCLCRVFAF
jgi:hypothetical protein